MTIPPIPLILIFWFFTEIYNEEIRDLLATEKGLKYDIKRVNAKSNEIYVSNLKIEDVSDGSENIKVLLKRAQVPFIYYVSTCIAQNLTCLPNSL